MRVIGRRLKATKRVKYNMALSFDSDVNKKVAYISNYSFVNDNADKEWDLQTRGATGCWLD